MQRGLAAVGSALLALGLVTVAVKAATGSPGAPRPAPAAVAAARAVTTTTAPAPHPPATTATTVRRSPPTSRPAPRPAVPRPAPRPPAPVHQLVAAVPLVGCPVPPHPPLPPAPPPWHPSHLVPDAALPPVVAPAPWRSNVAPVAGTGMWIWQWPRTDGGNAAAVVSQAVGAGLHQLWVRVGDSMNGFYGAQELAALVPAAHAARLSVIAWGFPYLYDPAGDARWTAQILAWRGPDGEAVDGYSADIERPSEGVDLTGQRAAVYLEQVRRAAGAGLVVATVYPPSDANWYGDYPYHAMAPYVDAFAPMVYWECTDPGAEVATAVARLSTLRPVHVIGQAFNFADVGGRTVSPSGAEITEFVGAGRLDGAVGASFWVWQSATPEEWAAVRAFRW